jgi:hypothetical protein
MKVWRQRAALEDRRTLGGIGDVHVRRQHDAASGRRGGDESRAAAAKRSGGHGEFLSRTWIGMNAVRTASLSIPNRSTPVRTRKLRHVIPLGPPRATRASHGARRARPFRASTWSRVLCGGAARRGDGPCTRTCKARDRGQMPFIDIDHVSSMRPIDATVIQRGALPMSGRSQTLQRRRGDSYRSTLADWLADLAGRKQSSESSSIKADPR